MIYNVYSIVKIERDKMVVYYIILIILIILLFMITFVCWLYQKKLAKVAFKDSFDGSLEFIDDDILQVDSSYDVPEIISSSVLEDTSDK